jgi:5-methylcytosine-specific restriction protein A
MRRSHETNTLVLISDHTKSLYEDRWVGDTFHYTGMGRYGHQSLRFAQNRTLYESATNGVQIHLFEVFRPTEYTYIGRVKLAGEPYQERQPDEEGRIRLVWVFPLRLVGDDGEIVALPQSVIEDKMSNRERMAQRLDDKSLRLRAQFASSTAARRQTLTTTYERNPYVAELARRRAKGHCQLCGNPAPFLDKHGRPFLEIHHIDWLANGGEDSIQNTVALCPNCHRKMHVLNDPADVPRLKEIARKPF